MSMKELLNGDCGQVNPVLRVASHFAGAGPSSEQGSVAPIHIVGRTDQNHAAQFANVTTHPTGRMLPPTTFRMDSLLKEIQSMDRTQGPSQAPRVVDLTSSEDWVREFQRSNDLNGAQGVDQKWTGDFHSRNDSQLDFDRAWEEPGNIPFPHPSSYLSHRHAPALQGPYRDPMLDSAQEILNDSKWSTEYEQDSRTELMATAEEFLNSMSDPTIQATEFMKFVEKLSTGEAPLADTERPVEEVANSWANEFEAQPPVAGENWAQQYVSGDSDSLNSSERQEFWQKLQNEWDRTAEESGYQHPWLSDSSQQFNQPYRFEEENPYKDIDDPLEEGRRRLMASDIPAAALLFEMAVQKQADNPEAWYLLGTTQALNEQDPHAISALSKCIELQPDNLKASMAMAASLTNESYHLQACRMLKTWLKQNPKYSVLVPENIESLSSPTSFLPNNELAAVQNLYIRAARQSPSENLDADVQCGLGILFNLSSDYDKAADCFQAAVNADPNNALMWNRLGATLANGGKSAEAIGAYSKALEIIPGFIRTRYNLGIACVNLGAYNEAAEHFLSALNLQAASKSAVSYSVDIKKTMSDSIWTSLRMVLHLLDKGKLSSAIDRRDLSTLNQEFGVA